MPPEKSSPLAAATVAGNGRETDRVSVTSKYRASVADCQAFSTQQPPNRMLAHALRYALAGWRVLPLQPGGKAPLTEHGVHDASRDPEQIGEWWQRWPSANIGLAIPDDAVVLDVDPRHGGRLEYLHRLDLDETTTATQLTPGGGWHVVYKKPPTMAFEGHLASLPGVDVLTTGRYIVVAPSTVAGRPYRWERDLLDVEPARLPLVVAERLQKRPPVASSSSTTNASSPATDAPPFHVVEHALAHLDPWRGGYEWWLAILMSLHSAYPGADGLALAERWGDGKPGEIAGKWRSFDAAGGITIGRLLAEAKTIGWTPALAGEAQPSRETAHDILHAQLEKHGGNCAICGKSFFETAVVGDVVRGRRRVMMCHRRDCGTWQSVKIKRQVMEAKPWEWGSWHVSEHTVEEWRRLINGPLTECDDWLGAPTVSGTICAFTGHRLADCASTEVSLQTMLTMAAERLLAIPEHKRLRRPKAAARAKREAVETAEPVATVEAAPASKLGWTRWAFGLDLLDDKDAWTVLAIVEKNGGTVTPKGAFSYPLRLDENIRAAVASWMEPSRREISAFSPLAPEYASISPDPPLHEQPGYRRMSPDQQRYARLVLHGDTNRAFIERQLAQAA